VADSHVHRLLQQEFLGRPLPVHGFEGLLKPLEGLEEDFSKH
jgi:hypothetical protein